MHEPPTVVIDPNEVSLLRTLGTATKPCLILYSGPDAGQRFDLEPGPQIIGRVPEAQVRIDGAGISRQHAELLVGAGHTVLVHDLGSANGTLVNEARIGEPTALKDGDFIRVSNVVLRFHSHNSLDLLLHDRIYQQATVDAGTGAFNRKYLHDTLRQQFAKARAGGEEFTLVLPNTGVAGALDVAERIRQAMAQFPIELPDPLNKTSSKPVEHRQTVSMGVAELGPEMASELDLLQAGDRALYAAKRRGRNQVSV